MPRTRLNDNCIGLIPAAGKGLRLNLPYPKELYPIIRNNRYKPVSQFVLNNIVNAGAGHVVFVINETKHLLIGYFGSGSRFGCSISYVVQESVEAQTASTSPGLAHALDAGYHLTRGKTVLFGMADTIMQPGNVFDYAWENSSDEDDLVLCLFPTDHPEKFGMVESAPDGLVRRVVDKPRQTELTLMWGCILWQPKFSEFLHEAVNTRGVYDFAQILNEAIASGMRVRGIPIPNGNYIDLGTYEEIVEMDRRFREE
jgi:glucose-1-phosphate thymidylyltransferase